jgi:hypothetical protein
MTSEVSGLPETSTDLQGLSVAVCKTRTNAHRSGSLAGNRLVERRGRDSNPREANDL